MRYINGLFEKVVNIIKLLPTGISNIEKKKLVITICVQLCLTLFDYMDCSPPGSLAHGIFQARILERVAISYSKGSSQPRD